MESERLLILREAELIDQETFEKVSKIMKAVIDRFGLDLESENGQMFITHVSMAVMRIKNNEATVVMENEIFEEIKESIHYNDALKFSEIIEEIIEYNVPKHEKEYLIINGCLLMEKD